MYIIHIYMYISFKIQNLFDNAKTGKLIVVDLPEGYVEREQKRGVNSIFLSS